MGTVLGQVLPLAAGVAVSPVPVIAVILMLLSPAAGAASRGFLLGWLAGIITDLLIFAVVAAGAEIGGHDQPSVVAAVIHLLLGVLLLVLAARQWRARPRPGQQPALPHWLGAVDRITTAGAAGLGFLLAAVNPKNLVLLASAGVDLGRAELSGAAALVAGAVVVLVAAVSVLLPVVVYAVARDRAAAWLDTLRSWLVDHNAAVMTVLLTILGVVVIGNGIAAW